MSKLYFSLQEANELIQRISPRVQRIIQLRDELNLLDNTKIEFDNESIENYLLEVELNKSFHEKNLEMYSLLGELIREGCLIRDLEELEIDFYSKYNERDITLCWKPGQEKIFYWHFPHEAHRKKRSINEIEKKYLEKLNELK